MWAVLHKPEKSKRMAKWVIELSEFDIPYKSRTAIKSQVLANFIVEFTLGIDVGTPKQAMSIWGLMVDGSLNSRGSGVGILITTLEGEQM